MSLLLSRYCTLLLPELQASEDSHGAFILRTWSSMSVLSIRFRYYMSAHEGTSSFSKSRVIGNFELHGATDFQHAAGTRYLRSTGTAVACWFSSSPAVEQTEFGK